MKGRADNLVHSFVRPKPEPPPSRTWQIQYAQCQLVKAAIEVERARENLRKDRGDTNQTALQDAELRLTRATRDVMRLTDYS